MSGYRGIPDLVLHVFSLGEIRRLLTRSGFGNLDVITANVGRTRELRWRFLTSLRSNGFILIARKPPA